jgi:hypothetical protein
MYKFLFVFLLLLTGCASQENNNKLANQLKQDSPENILSILQNDDPDKGDRVQYYLNLGYLQLLSGEFATAIESLSIAKNEMQDLAASSVSENIGAGTINETLRSYSGYPLDRVMVHNMLALSYLFSQDIEGARVEVLQADIEMKKLAGDADISNQLASTHLISAIIYELLDERSNAFISYQLAENSLIKRQIPLPEGLKLGLLRSSYLMGNDEQYTYYSQQYPALVDQVNTNAKQVFVLYFDGVVDNKVERTVVVPNISFNQLIRVSVPGYPNHPVMMDHAFIDSGAEQAKSQLVEDVNVAAREDLDKEYPSILALTTTRAVSKYLLVKEAQEKDPLIGILFNFATLLSEVADLRSWNMLPATVQFGYLNTYSNELAISTSLQFSNTINLSQGKQHVILATSLSNNLFHYQQ